MTKMTVALSNCLEVPNNDSNEGCRDRRNSSMHFRFAYYSRDPGVGRVTSNRKCVGAFGLDSSGSGFGTVVWSCEQGMNTWAP